MKSKSLTFLFISIASVAAFSQMDERVPTKMDVSTICPDCEPLLKSAQEEKDVLVQIKAGATPQQLIKDLKKDGAVELSLKKEIVPRFGFYLFSLKHKPHYLSPLEIIKRHPNVISAQWDSPVEFRDSIPNDPQWPAQWDMDRIGLPDVWGTSTGGLTANGHEIVVAVLDSGFDLTHEDLQGNIWKNKREANGAPNVDDDGNGFVDDVSGWNFINNSNVLSVTGHGTSVAGLIGGKGNNGIGITGVNWDVKMMFLNVDLVSEVVAAFNYVLEQRELYNATNGAEGAFVVVTNGSFGKDATQCSSLPTWGAMYDLLGQAGILNIAATANENWNVDEVGDMPTTCTSDFLVAVTASNNEDERVSNAAFGPTSIDLAAPGQETIATTLDDRYNESFGGTSAACPHVAGAVALLYSLPCPELDSLALADPPAAALLMREALLQNVVPLSSLKDKIVTGGRLDVYESMKYIHAWCIGLTEDRSSDQVKEVYLGRRGLVRLFPNPVSEALTVDFAAFDFDQSISFRIFNALGQEVQFPESGKAVPFEKQQVTVDVADWASGVYTVNIFDRTQKISKAFLKL